MFILGLAIGRKYSTRTGLVLLLPFKMEPLSSDGKYSYW